MHYAFRLVDKNRERNIIIIFRLTIKSRSLQVLSTTCIYDRPKKRRDTIENI
jgi:hypothetical protein